MRKNTYGKIDLRIYESRDAMGADAAEHAAGVLRDMLAEKSEVNCIFAAATSQIEMLRALRERRDVEWSRINAFAMDEYVGMAGDAPQSFGVFLNESIFDHAPFKAKYLMDGLANPDAECARYAALLRDHPIDVVFMGIGENGHIAFNNPPDADFNDPLLVKTVTLADDCRIQYANDGSFDRIEDVPTRAITVTVPVLLEAKHYICVVSGKNKAPAIRAALTGPIGEACPGSVLQRTPGVKMYIDELAAELLPV